METEKICKCGDTEDQHIDNMEQCVISECGCQEFEEKEEKSTQFNFESVIKTMNVINKAIYGVEPYKNL